MPNPYEAMSTAKKHPVVSPTLEVHGKAGAEHETALPTPNLDTNDVPTGTIREILEWVGKDVKRAHAASKAEKMSKDPRPTLIDKLKKVGKS